MFILHEGAGALIACVVVTCGLMFYFRQAERKVLLALLAIFGVTLLAVAYSPQPAVNWDGIKTASIWYQFALYFLIVCLISIVGVTFFRGILPALGMASPRILQDVVVAVAHIAWTLILLSQAGVSLAGVVTTSAVLTAVIGFSMQDTLGNILGGLAIQLDQSIHKGDWIKVDDLIGKVIETRWRFTAIETRNWETVVIPNSVLMKNKFMVLGRRSGEPVQWRRWVYFNVDFRTPPRKVTETVAEAIVSADIERVAKKPAPNCIMMDFTESYGRYALRYWLTDLAVDDPTDSEVRAHIYVALQRAGIPLSIPAHALFVTQESEERKTTQAAHAQALRRTAMQHVDIFHSLKPEELDQLAGHLVPSPFAKGDVITRQGAEAHWLYILVEGHADVVVTKDDETRKVGDIGPGSVFGEMGLMTGEPRASTVIAKCEVECYRLDKESFQGVIRTRPEIAEELSHILAKRRADLDKALGLIDAEHNKLGHSQQDILGKIRKLFGV